MPSPRTSVEHTRDIPVLVRKLGLRHVWLEVEGELVKLRRGDTLNVVHRVNVNTRDI